MSVPTVSVVMPAWNAERFISEAIASVYLQSLREWELIVVDDGSTDNTPYIVERWTKADPRIRHVKLPKNSGVSIALNTGCDIARGKYIAFIGSDDIWFPHKLEESLLYLEQVKETHPDKSIVGVIHRLIVIKQEEGHGKTATSYIIKGLDPPHFLSGTLVGFSDIAYRNLRSAAPMAFLATASAIKSVGEVFNPTLSYGEDWDMLLRLTAGGAQLALLDKPLAIYRIHSSNLSAVTDWGAVAYLLYQTLKLAREHNHQLDFRKVVVRRLLGELFRKTHFTTRLSLLTISATVSFRHTLTALVDMFRLRFYSYLAISKRELQQEAEKVIKQVKHISEETISSCH